METIFAHSTGRADFIGGAVRLELITFAPDTAAVAARLLGGFGGAPITCD